MANLAGPARGGVDRNSNDSIGSRADDGSGLPCIIWVDLTRIIAEGPGKPPGCVADS